MTATPFELGQQAVADWPPLTDEQIDRLVFILRPYVPVQGTAESGEAA